MFAALADCLPIVQELMEDFYKRLGPILQELRSLHSAVITVLFTSQRSSPTEATGGSDGLQRRCRDAPSEPSCLIDRCPGLSEQKAEYDPFHLAVSLRAAMLGPRWRIALTGPKGREAVLDSLFLGRPKVESLRSGSRCSGTDVCGTASAALFAIAAALFRQLLAPECMWGCPIHL